MTVVKNSVVVDLEWVSDWLHYELDAVEDCKENPERLAYHQDLIEGALGVLGLIPTEYKAIIAGVERPKDETAMRKAREVASRLFGNSRIFGTNKTNRREDYT